MKIIKDFQLRLQRALPSDSLRGRFALGAFWSLVGTAIARGLELLASIIVARILGKTGFGELGMIRSTVGMFGTFAGLGLGLTASKYIAEFRVKAPERAGRIIGMSSLVALISGGSISIILFFLAPLLAEHTINAPYLVTELQIGCGLLFFQALIGAQTGALAGFEAFKTIAKVSFAQGVMHFSFMIVGVYLFGLQGAIAGQAIATAGGWLLSHIALRKESKKARVYVVYNNIQQELPILWKFSLPAVLSGSVVAPVMWGARAMLVNQPSGYSEMGIFSAAMRFQGLLYLMESTIGRPLLPMLASPDGSKSSVFNRVNILSSWLIGIVPAIPIICFPEIMGLFFGKEFMGISANRTLALVMFFTCIMLYKQGLARVLAANSLMWWGFLSNGVWAIVLIFSSYLMVRFGAVGLAASFTLAYALNTIIFIPLYTRRELVPKETIISKEAFTVWLVIGLLASLTILDYSIFVRAFAFIIGILFVLIAFIRILKSKGKVKA